MAKTLVQLLQSIKTECRIRASDDIDDWLKDVINQEYRLLCANSEYPELLVPFATLQIDSDGQSIYPFPVGLSQIVSVEFALTDTDPVWRPLVEKNLYAPYLSQGTPTWYFKSGASVHVFPYSQITQSHLLRITYYKEPDPLIEDDDVMEVPKLEEALIQRVNRRVMRYHKDEPEVQISQQDAVNAEIRVVE